MGFIVVFRDTPETNSHGGLLLFQEQISTIYHQGHYYHDWGPWKTIALATPPQEFDLPLAEGWSAMPSCKASYFKTQESVVYVTLNVVPDHAIVSQETICVLPVGFRPAHMIKVPVVAIMQDGTNDVGYCDIDSNGIVQIYNITGEVFELEISIATFVAAD